MDTQNVLPFSTAQAEASAISDTVRMLRAMTAVATSEGMFFQDETMLLGSMREAAHTVVPLMGMHYVCTYCTTDLQ